MSKALIFGITGQDGSYLADFLLKKGYDVAGCYRRTSHKAFERLEHFNLVDKVELVRCDIADEGSILRAIKDTKPDEIYNLAAQSFVSASFDQPVFTGETTGLGATRILEAVKTLNPNIKYYQASSSEMYGNSATAPQNENTPFRPNSPYAIAKLYAHHMTWYYREGHGIFGACGILFNHESPVRGLEFVTRKISMAVARIKYGLQEELHLGNLNAKRDWGFAGDYVEAMWMMLQEEKPDDYVIATGETHSVREFVDLAFHAAGLGSYEPYVKIDPKFIRPTEVNVLQGDSTKARKALGWKPTVKFNDLVDMMVKTDMKYVREKEMHKEAETK